MRQNPPASETVTVATPIESFDVESRTESRRRVSISSKALHFCLNFCEICLHRRQTHIIKGNFTLVWLD